jgi:16S rRNA pseudouridine516 synthase
MSKPPTLRLDRLLANLGYGSRKEVRDLIVGGEALLDGRALTDPGLRIALSPDLPQRLTLQRRPIDPPPPLVLMMHKPVGVVCSHKETGRRIYDLLPPRWRLRDPPLSSIGRLDKDTSGLLLITDDGDFLHRVISPRRHVPKSYVARLDRPLGGSEGEIFAAGTLMLEGEEKPLKPAGLEPIDAKTARLTIEEGRYHQVRRMFAAVGNHVVELHRDRIGGLALPADLEPGAYRVLSRVEAETVFAA